MEAICKWFHTGKWRFPRIHSSLTCSTSSSVSTTSKRSRHKGWCVVAGEKWRCAHAVCLVARLAQIPILLTAHALVLIQAPTGVSAADESCGLSHLWCASHRWMTWNIVTCLFITKLDGAGGSRLTQAANLLSYHLLPRLDTHTGKCPLACERNSNQRFLFPHTQSSSVDFFSFLCFFLHFTECRLLCVQ